MSSLKRYILFIPKLVEGSIKFTPLVSDEANRFRNPMGTFAFDVGRDCWYVLEPANKYPNPFSAFVVSQGVFWKQIQNHYLHIAIPEELINSKDALLLLLVQ